MAEYQTEEADPLDEDDRAEDSEEQLNDAQDECAHVCLFVTVGKLSPAVCCSLQLRGPRSTQLNAYFRQALG